MYMSAYVENCSPKPVVSRLSRVAQVHLRVARLYGAHQDQAVERAIALVIRESN